MRAFFNTHSDFHMEKTVLDHCSISGGSNNLSQLENRSRGKCCKEAQKGFQTTQRFIFLRFCIFCF